jgi:hypothetical protein
VNNRFSRAYNTAELNLNAVEDYRRRTQVWESAQLKLEGAGDVGTARRKTVLQWPNPFDQPAVMRGGTGKDEGTPAPAGRESLSKPVKREWV